MFPAAGAAGPVVVQGISGPAPSGWAGWFGTLLACADAASLSWRANWVKLYDSYRNLTWSGPV
jgi:hypothetical protein